MCHDAAVLAVQGTALFEACRKDPHPPPRPHRSDQKQAGKPLSKGRLIDSEQWRPSHWECKAGLPGTVMTAVGRATLCIWCQVLAHSLHGLRAVMEAPLPGPGMAPGLLSTAPGECQCPAWLQVSPQLFLLELGVRGRDGGSAHPGLTSTATPSSPWTEPALPSEPLPANTSDETSILSPVHCESHPNAWIASLHPQPPQTEH